MADRYLTKSLFKNFRPCARRFWHLANQPNLFPPPTEAERMRFEDGKRVDALAQSLFPHGVSAFVGGLTEEAVARTQERLESDAEVIFQPTFVAGDLMVRCDMIRRVEDGWELIEVKSAIGFRRDHEIDLGFQWLVLERAGLPITRASIIHINGQWVRGDSMTPQELLVERDVTDYIRDAALRIEREVDQAIQVMLLEEPPMQELMPFCKSCALIDECHFERSRVDVAFLPRIRADKVTKLRAEGISLIHEADKKHVTGQQRLVWLALQNQGIHTEPGLKKWLNRVVFPAAFIDFEAANPVLPVYSGVRPGQQIPFQWSCHTAHAESQLTEEELTHSEFLETRPIDPRVGFAESLWEAVRDAESIVYYSPFEPTRLKELKEEGIPYGAELYERITKVGVDLYEAVAKNAYLEGFEYSWSIKTVLPALIKQFMPDLAQQISYKNLEVQNGEVAVIQYMRMIQSGTTDEERERIANALREYCGLDSFAMVKVYEALRRLTG